MLNGFNAEHWMNDGKPAGGCTYGTGFAISWQNGPLGRGEERRAPNGAFVEDIIASAIDRLEWYQQGEFACMENAQAIQDLRRALESLNQRTLRREERGVEGTHAK